jgi:outer membrane protein assembly factor BamB
MQIPATERIRAWSRRFSVAVGLCVAGASIGVAAFQRRVEVQPDAFLINPRLSVPGPVELTAPQVPLVSGTTAARLEQVQALVADSNWDDAIDTLRGLAGAESDRVVAVDANRYVSLRTYCQMQIAKLPTAARKRYRERVDSLAERWYREGLAARDEKLLRRVVDEAYCSSWGDDALFTLGELALERADYRAAREYWTQISPQLRGGDWLAYPDTEIDLAAVRARLVLTSIRAGDLTKATSELDVLRNEHGQASGRLAGQEGPLAPALPRVLEAARAWKVAPPSATWPTFAGSNGRNGVAAPLGAITGPAWREAIRFQMAAASGYPAMPDSERPQNFFPIVAKGRIYYADAMHVYAAALAEGRPAITEAGVIYREQPTSPDRPIFVTGSPLTVPARSSLTLVGDVLYARVGPPTTARIQGTERAAGDSLVGLDLTREGLLAFRPLPEEDREWSFDGVPVGDGERLYVAMRRSDVNPQAAVACFDAATGQRVWRTSIGSANTPAAGRGDEITHNLLTLIGERIYFNTNLGLVAALRTADGAICWMRQYERSKGTGEGRLRGEPRAHFQRDPSPALYADGMLIVAPSDTPRVFALDAETGGEIWSSDELADAVHLLGAVDGTLIASGHRLWYVDARTGRVQFTWPEADEKSVRGMGRGVIAGREVFWPTQKEIYVLDTASGAQTRAPISLAAVGESGANLIAVEGYLIAAGFDRMMAYGGEGRGGAERNSER